jgi:hypothetical protein
MKDSDEENLIYSHSNKIAPRHDEITKHDEIA